MLAKAPGLGADELVLDLEDAVAAVAKDEARAQVLAALVGLGRDAYDPGGPARPHASVAVRVNAPRSPWCHLDLTALAAAPPQALASVVVPKVESAGDLAFVERLLDGAEKAAGRDRPLRIQALIETAAGLARVQEIAAASPRLDALILGYADLAASLGRSAAGRADLAAWDAARDTVLVAARANGLQAIDGPYLGLEPDAAFHAAATRARDLGFDGKWAIHPSQVVPLNELFTPDEDELAWARRVVDALDRGAAGVDALGPEGAAAADGNPRGAVALDGQMLDEAVRVAALRTLARAPGSGVTP